MSFSSCSFVNIPNLPIVTSSYRDASEPDSVPPILQGRKLKGSPQLNRWSRARTLRSGRRLDRRGGETHGGVVVENKGINKLTASKGDDEDLDGVCEAERPIGKSIYMVSDGTGWTAEHSVNAALGQFEHCLVDRGCPVNTHLFSGVTY
ncbi:hypothetical protein ACFE04_020456 [Oxalis oulophora]